MSQATFVEVILPLATPKTYTYALPFDKVAEVKVGQRVIVQFGKRKIYAGIIFEIHHRKPLDYQAKLIEDLVSEEVVVNAQQLALWQWISSYYLCTLGEVMAAALPSALKLSSETFFVYLENEDFDWAELDNEAFLLAEALQANGELSLEDIQDVLQKKTVYPTIEVLMHHRLCLLKEELQEKYKVKQITYLRLHSRFHSETALQALFEKLSASEKQTAILLHYLHFSPTKNWLSKTEFLANKKISESSLKTLLKNEIFEEEKQTVSRIMGDKLDVQDLENLNPAQATALHNIQEYFTEKPVVVLEGVTGSGKTHIYIKLMEEALAAGKEVLYLLPEIALTAQIVIRLQKYFGNKIAVYHSKFNDQERVEIYRSVLEKKTPIILAARSGVFLPFSNLGLIIVDEEHERSYKQFDPAPRYHARDTAIMLAKEHKAKVLLGSATLSFETYYNVQQGKFAHVYLSERHGSALLPSIELIDTLDLKKRKQMQGLFSESLKEAISLALANKEQVILFQNRRGFANYANCNLCNWIPFCPNCDVSLTYHKFFNKLVCHYCGHQEKMIENCKACGSHDVQVKGFGTEQIEDDMQILFPSAKIARLDLDSTRRKHGHEEIIFDFQNEAIDILIGTQMVTKGLDFDNVSLVGIIEADQLLNFPDFRAGEKAFQLLSQVGGRAGRKEKKGRVLIQSKQVAHPVLQAVQHYAGVELYEAELAIRKQYSYPPFVHLIQITVKHKSPDDAKDAAAFMAKLLKTALGKGVLGPSTPLISKVKNMYLRQILIKVPKNAAVIASTKASIQQATEQTLKQFKTAWVVVEVDA